MLSNEEVVAKDGVEKQTYQRTIAKPAASIAPSRKLLPAHLPRIEVVLEPEEDTSAMKKIGEQVSEELDYEPAKLFVRRYVRPRYVSAEEDFYVAALPNRPIDNHSMTEASLEPDYWLRFSWISSAIICPSTGKYSATNDWVSASQKAHWAVG
ncbi:IS66 family transposase zinc-finger binding domain-containing protein [Tunicatimonas pelagia]|uniref:IS66 family transposase zinc-finger binding domain-containing protein n=1 Tax=Tunicatimonas pelagia TaxID=931531 RepID=UPI002665536C|nr:IS66 family transposase zinc-finger binding domain-containing protein [Tunicatimonas pelagia]WKN41684.1 IS66 family transposase zinc-finger binding domain-containing protein [Tunicatimonas pelagia]WKN45272.1 IS66 family transposase zinc-finger binding domain-containing protein [Tunicatimonas pelagia]